MRKMNTFAIVLTLCIWCMACLAGCGKEEEPQRFDLQVEQEPFYDVAANEDVYTHFLSMQFYRDEPVQLWIVYDGVSSMDAYLYRMDGSRELILKDVPKEYRHGGGFLDKDGNYYYWAVNQESIIKVDSSGKQVFCRQLSDFDLLRIENLCQLEDGRVYAKCRKVDNGEGAYWVCSINPDTGEIAKVNGAVSETDYYTYVAAGEGCLLYLTEEGVERVDAEKGTREEEWPFAGTSYARDHRTTYLVWDFRILEDGSLELLEAESHSLAKGSDGSVKALRKVAVGEEREIVVLRGTYLVYDEWIKECIRSFNEQSKDWYVMLEECGNDDSLWEDYARQTSIEIASGEGPDILYGNVLSDYVYGVIKQGGFADLSPYLESSGLSRDDFFPCVFDCWQEEGKIYGVSLNITFLRKGSILMDAAVLGDNEEPDIETLVNALLTWEGDAALLKAADPEGVLERFLVGSENLWGMVDWEEKSCDFGTELFAGILEIAKRYGRSGRNDARPLLAEEEMYSTYEYLDSALLEKSGKVKVGILFDDGCHAAADSECVAAVNANSPQKEGAWEFIRFVLEDRQVTKKDVWRYPAGKEAFDRAMASEKAKGLWEDGRALYNKWDDTMMYFYPLTEKRIKELKAILEDTRFTPIRTEPILDIICQEAAEYFGGTKSVEEVIDMVNNRVQVLLDEGTAQQAGGDDAS